MAISIQNSSVRQLTAPSLASGDDRLRGRMRVPSAPRHRDRRRPPDGPGAGVCATNRVPAATAAPVARKPPPPHRPGHRRRCRACSSTHRPLQHPSCASLQRPASVRAPPTKRRRAPRSPADHRARVGTAPAGASRSRSRSMARCLPRVRATSCTGSVRYPARSYTVGTCVCSRLSVKPDARQSARHSWSSCVDRRRPRCARPTATLPMQAQGCGAASRLRKTDRANTCRCATTEPRSSSTALNESAAGACSHRRSK